MTHVYIFKTNSVEKRPLYVGVSRLVQLLTIELKSLIYCIQIGQN